MLASNTSRFGTAQREGRGGTELNVLLAVDTDHERGNVNQVLADSDVTLLDNAASMVDGGGHVLFFNNGLQAAVQEFLDGQTEHVIQLLFSL